MIHIVDKRGLTVESGNKKLSTYSDICRKYFQLCYLVTNKQIRVDIYMISGIAVTVHAGQQIQSFRLCHTYFTYTDTPVLTQHQVMQFSDLSKFPKKKIIIIKLS